MKIYLTTNNIGHATLIAEDQNRNKLGWLELADPRPGLEGHLVLHIEVKPEHRRKGIATALWLHAKKFGANPIHAIDKTPDGAAWAKAVGD